MEGEKRITVRVPESFHREVKAKAAREGMTISELLCKLLDAWLLEDYTVVAMNRAPEQ